MTPMSRKIHNPTHAQALVQLRTGRDLPELLEELYVGEGLTQEQVAARIGVTRLTAVRWLREFDIRRPEAIA
jgi:DNA-binding XRE family transcriptional regulator